jgi:hypothetical protein
MVSYKQENEMTAARPTIATLPSTGATASGKGGFAPVSGNNGATASGLIV